MPSLARPQIVHGDVKPGNVFVECREAVGGKKLPVFGLGVWGYMGCVPFPDLKFNVIVFYSSQLLIFFCFFLIHLFYFDSILVNYVMQRICVFD